MCQPYITIEVNTSYHSSGLNVLFSGSSQTTPSHKCGPQVLDYYLLHYVLDGYGTFQSGDQTYTLGPGEAFLIFPGEIVTYESDAAEPWLYK
jgi:mannose-6-phosphate isomerase class I